MDSLLNEPRRGFEVNEFEIRTANAQVLMEQAGLSALLFCTEPEVRYYSGFHTPFWLSPTRPWFLIIPLKGKPIAVIPTIGKSSMSSTWLDDIRHWAAPQPEDDGITLLADTLQEVAGDDGKIGMPMGHETNVRLPAKDFDWLRKLLGIERIVDATNIVRSQRMIKSEAEIEKIAHICSIASDTFEGLPNLINLGDTERSVFKAMRIDLLQRGADDVPYLVGSSEAGGISDIIKLPTNRILCEGDLMLLDTGAIFDGYYCDFDRLYSFGHCDDASRRAYDIVYAATEAGIEAARPGLSCAELFKKMSDVLSANNNDLGDVGRLGHGLGMQLTEWPSHTTWDNTILEPGMVITLEPGMNYGAGKLMLHEENILICETGARLLSRRAPTDIPIID
jgi:Xaa-Pro dipeptidase